MMYRVLAAALLATGLAACEEGEVEPRPDIDNTDISAGERDIEGIDPAELPPTPDGVLDPDGPAIAPVSVTVEGQAVTGCPTRGTVRESAEVYAGPQPTTDVIDTLDDGTGLILCEQGLDMVWWGVVYAGLNQSLDDCDTSSALSTGNTYQGPCRIGWVMAQDVEWEPQASVPVDAGE